MQINKKLISKNKLILYKTMSETEDFIPVPYEESSIESNQAEPYPSEPCLPSTNLDEIVDDKSSSSAVGELDSPNKDETCLDESSTKENVVDESSAVETSADESSADESSPDESEASYIFNDVDYTSYVKVFLENPNLYYDLITMYSTSKEVLLKIDLHNCIYSNAYLHPDNTIHQCIESSSKNVYPNIVEWVKVMLGSSYSVEHLFTNVYIGENETPLWKVLEVAKNGEVPNNSKTIIITKYFPQYFISFIIFIYFCISVALLIWSSKF